MTKDHPRGGIAWMVSAAHLILESPKNIFCWRNKLKKKTILSGLLLIFLVSVFAPIQQIQMRVSAAPLLASCTPITNTLFESRLIAKLNQARERAGIAVLKANALLTKAAHAQSIDMACKGFLSNTGSDGSTLAIRLNRVGYRFTLAAELINDTEIVPGDAIDIWLESSSTRAILRDLRYTEIGGGYAYTSAHGDYFTVVLAHPK